MGSKTPITHGSSFIQFVISRRIADLHSRRIASRPLRLRDRLAFPSQLTAHDTFLTVSASVGTRPPRTTCRVRPRPRRRCSKSEPRLRCRSSVLLLQARLLVTFSCLRSF